MENIKKQIKMSEFLEIIEELDSNQYKLLLEDLKEKGIDIIDDDFEYSISDNIVKDYLKSLGKYPILTKEEEICLFENCKKGDLKARTKLIESNLKLVVWVAKRYANNISGTTIDFMDLVQEGSLGLIKAASRFDYKKGFKFSLNFSLKSTLNLLLNEVMSKPSSNLRFNMI